MNDMRKDRFTEELIEYLETIGESLEFAFQKFFLY